MRAPVVGGICDNGHHDHVSIALLSQLLGGDALIPTLMLIGTFTCSECGAPLRFPRRADADRPETA